MLLENIDLKQSSDSLIGTPEINAQRNLNTFLAFEGAKEMLRSIDITFSSRWWYEGALKPTPERLFLFSIGSYWSSNASMLEQLKKDFPKSKLIPLCFSSLEPYSQNSVPDRKTEDFLFNELETCLVRDFATQRYLQKTGIVKKTIEVVIGPCLFFPHRPFLFNPVQPTVVVGPHSTQTESPDLEQRISLINQLRKSCRVIYLSQIKNELETHDLFSLETIHCPEFPEVSATALVSAGAVIGFSLEPIVVSALRGIPSILVSDNPYEIEMAEWLSIPWLSTRDIQSGISLETLKSSFLTKSVQQKLRQCQEKMTSSLSLYSAATSTISRKVSKTSEKTSVEVVRICCISDSNFAPFLIAFIENISRVYSERVELHILKLAPFPTDQIEKHFSSIRFFFYELSSLFSPTELERLSNYSVPSRAYTAKSRLMLRVLELTRRPVLYSDLDIFFFEPPNEIFDELQDKSVVIFPNWEGSLSGIHRRGLYGGGLIGVSDGAQPFLELWAELCLDECSSQPIHGFWHDQSYLNLIPIYFDKVKIFRKLGHNVGTWSVHSLGMRFCVEDPFRLVVSENIRVKSLHAAVEDSLGGYRLKYAWDQATSQFAGIPFSKTDAIKNNFIEQHRLDSKNLSRFFYLCGKLPIGLKRRLYKPSVFANLLTPIGKIALSGSWILWRLCEGLLTPFNSRRKKNALIENAKDWWWIDLINRTEQRKQVLKADQLRGAIKEPGDR